MNLSNFHRVKVAAREMAEMNLRVLAFGTLFGIIPYVSYTLYKERNMTRTDRVQRYEEMKEKKRKQVWEE
ncbi:hypothetical protein DIPPA_70021 [Diplonema papillatum]|nr:hypothetical protein DIPPA_70021 [Diplonema papillatum]